MPFDEECREILVLLGDDMDRAKQVLLRREAEMKDRHCWLPAIVVLQQRNQDRSVTVIK